MFCHKSITAVLQTTSVYCVLKYYRHQSLFIETTEKPKMWMFFVTQCRHICNAILPIFTTLTHTKWNFNIILLSRGQVQHNTDRNIDGLLDFLRTHQLNVAIFIVVDLLVSISIWTNYCWSSNIIRQNVTLFICNNSEHAQHYEIYHKPVLWAVPSSQPFPSTDQTSFATEIATFHSYTV